METQTASTGEQIAPKKRGPDVSEVARESLDAADGDLKKATEIMEERVRRNRRLRDALTEPALSVLCYEQISKLRRAQRGEIWRAPNYDAGGKGDRVAQLARGNALMLLSFPLPNGKPLGEATFEEVEDAARFYDAQASDMAHKARWLALIASERQAEKLVRDVMTEERLRILKEQAHGQ